MNSAKSNVSGLFYTAAWKCAWTHSQKRISFTVLTWWLLSLRILRNIHHVCIHHNPGTFGINFTHAACTCSVLYICESKKIKPPKLMLMTAHLLLKHGKSCNGMILLRITCSTAYTIIITIFRGVFLIHIFDVVYQKNHRIFYFRSFKCTQSLWFHYITI